MENEYWFPALIGFLIWVLILYLLISNAVKNGTSNHEYYLKRLTRMKMRELVDKGYSTDEIHFMFESNDDKFWADLKELENKRSKN